jgi:hypothetical protein
VLSGQTASVGVQSEDRKSIHATRTFYTGRTFWLREGVYLRS